MTEELDYEEHDCNSCWYFDFIECDDEHTYGGCKHPTFTPPEGEMTDCKHWVSEHYGPSDEFDYSDMYLDKCPTEEKPKGMDGQ